MKYALFYKYFNTIQCLLLENITVYCLFYVWGYSCSQNDRNFGTYSKKLKTRKLYTGNEYLKITGEFFKFYSL